mmetsp:Transcript_63522/g.164888  ORF Transcript_63522/g.164888 Transcript_63522/m.164888 type:complete len:209 (+) Transcript_63522:153-779(+)
MCIIIGMHMGVEASSAYSAVATRSMPGVACKPSRTPPPCPPVPLSATSANSWPEGVDSSSIVSDRAMSEESKTIVKLPKSISKRGPCPPQSPGAAGKNWSKSYNSGPKSLGTPSKDVPVSTTARQRSPAAGPQKSILCPLAVIPNTSNCQYPSCESCTAHQAGAISVGDVGRRCSERQPPKVISLSSSSVTARKTANMFEALVCSCTS